MPQTGNFRTETQNELEIVGTAVKFSRLDNTLSRQLHLDKLSSKLSSVSYITRTLKPILTIENLNLIYYSYVHSIISYGLIFWGNSSQSKIIFKLQKRIIRIITNSNYRTTCRDLFKKLNILPLQSQFILSLALSVVGNLDDFSINFDLHSFNTPQKFLLHPPPTRMTTYQKGVHYMGVKIFNKIPPKIQCLISNKKQFLKTLKKFLLLVSFYTIEEFYNWSSISDLHAAYM